MTTPIAPCRVHTLVGRSTIDVTKICLPTAVRYSAEPIRILVHEDGTLTEANRDTLRDAIPGVEFISRERADDEVGDALRQYRLCRRARETNVMFLKIFDVTLLEPGELCYCDSDILFLRPFSGIFGPSNSPFAGHFMADVSDAYAVRPWDLRPIGRIRLARNLNAGLMRISSRVFDLDYIEWLLGQMEGRSVWIKRQCWNEQTCWAGLAARVPCGLWDPRQVVMATREMAAYSADTVAIHFVSTYRDLLAEYVDRRKPTTAAPVAMRSKEAAIVGPLRQLLSDSRARMISLRRAAVRQKARLVGHGMGFDRPSRNEQSPVQPAVRRHESVAEPTVLG